MAKNPGPADTVKLAEIPDPFVKPWDVPTITVPDAAAIRAVFHGDASAEQQRRAIEVIVSRVCGMSKVPFCPGSDAGTNFMAGRHFAGRIITSICSAKGASKEDG